MINPIDSTNFIITYNISLHFGFLGHFVIIFANNDNETECENFRKETSNANAKSTRSKSVKIYSFLLARNFSKDKYVFFAFVSVAFVVVCKE